MIICLIEFQTHPGMEAEQQKWLQTLLPIVGDVTGFRGKSYSHVSGDGRTSTVSLGRRRSLANWTATLVTEKPCSKAKSESFPAMKSEYAANCAIMAMRPPEIGSVGVPDAVRGVNHDRLGFR